MFQGNYELASKHFDVAMKLDSGYPPTRNPALVQRTIGRYRDLLFFKVNNDAFTKDAINILSTDIETETAELPRIEPSTESIPTGYSWIV